MSEAGGIRGLAIATRDSAMTSFNRARIALGADGGGRDSVFDGGDADLTDVQLDGYVDRYDELKPVLDEMAADLAAHVSPLLGEGKAVLDFGCGTGRYLELFETPGVRLVGVDVNRSVLERITAVKHPSAEIHATDITFDPSFAEENRGAFDAVYSMSVIQYIRPSSQGRVFRSFAEMLRPGGLLYVTFPHPQHWYDEAPNIGYIRYRPDRVEAGLERAGFEIAESRAIHHGYRVRGIDRSAKPNYGYVVIARRS